MSDDNDEARRVVNTWEQMRLAGTSVAIVKSYGGIREKYVSGWHVLRFVNGVHVPSGKKQEGYHPDNPHHDKAFSSFGPRDKSFGERQQIALAAAVKWVKAQGWYDGEWVGNAQGDKVPVAVNKQWPIKRRRRLETTG